MKVVPDYYDEFQCIAGSCKDSCCIGWDVYVDQVSAQRYQNVKGELGQRLKKELVMEEDPYIRMKQDGRCPFLNKENLCDIYIELGEDALCDICTRHPRFMETYENITEIGLGISCEVSAKLILNHKGKVRFLEYETKESEPEISDKLYRFIQYRNQMMDWMQERHVSIFKRWQKVLDAAVTIQNISLEDENEVYTIATWVEEVTSVFLGLESMTSTWKEILNHLEDVNGKRKVSEEFWEQLSVYFLYRYVLKSYYDDNMLEKVLIGLISFLGIYHWSLRYNIDPIEFVRLYSKEVEYSEDNIEVLKEEFLFGGCFSVNTLKDILVASEFL